MVKDLLDKLRKEFKGHSVEVHEDVVELIDYEVCATKEKLAKLNECMKEQEPDFYANAQNKIEALNDEFIELVGLLENCVDDIKAQIWFGVWLYITFGIRQVVESKYINVALGNFCEEWDCTHMLIDIIEQRYKN